MSASPASRRSSASSRPARLNTYDPSHCVEYRHTAPPRQWLRDMRDNVEVNYLGETYAKDIPPKP